MPNWARCEDVDFEKELLPWTYCGSFPAATLFASLFCILTLAHFVQAFVFRKKFCWVIVMAGLWSTAGFALRALSTHMMREDAVYVPMQLLIILAPIWLNAFIYMVLGRMVHFFVPEQKCFGIKARKLTVIFLCLDIFSFIVQGAAGSLTSSEDPELIRIGINVYMGGVGMQELFIIIFTGLAMRFHYKMNKVEATDPGTRPWRPLLYTEYAGCFLITLRIIYRLIEYSKGPDSPLAKAEAAFYILDGVPMVIAMALFNYFHPGRYLVGPDSEFPKKEKKKKKKKSKKGKKEKNLEAGDITSDNEYTEVGDRDSADIENVAQGNNFGDTSREDPARRSRRSRRSRRRGTMGSMSVGDVEFVRHADFDMVPLRRDPSFDNRPIRDAPMGQSHFTPYPH